MTDRGDPDNCGPIGPACTAALTSVSKTVTITVTPVNDSPRLLGWRQALARSLKAIQSASMARSPIRTLGIVMPSPLIGGMGQANTILSLAPGVFTFSALHCYKDDSPSGSSGGYQQYRCHRNGLWDPPSPHGQRRYPNHRQQRCPGYYDGISPVDPALINTVCQRRDCLHGSRIPRHLQLRGPMGRLPNEQRKLTSFIREPSPAPPPVLQCRGLSSSLLQ